MVLEIITPLLKSGHTALEDVLMGSVRILDGDSGQPGHQSCHGEDRGCSSDKQQKVSGK